MPFVAKRCQYFIKMLVKETLKDFCLKLDFIINVENVNNRDLYTCFRKFIIQTYKLHIKKQFIF